jgi:hypothetical protein
MTLLQVMASADMGHGICVTIHRCKPLRLFAVVSQPETSEEMVDVSMSTIAFVASF